MTHFLKFFVIINLYVANFELSLFLRDEIVSKSSFIS